MKALYLLLPPCVLAGLECTDKPTSSGQVQSAIISESAVDLCYCMLVRYSRNHVKSSELAFYLLGKLGFFKSQMEKRK